MEPDSSSKWSMHFREEPGCLRRGLLLLWRTTRSLPLLLIRFDLVPGDQPPPPDLGSKGSILTKLSDPSGGQAEECCCLRC